MRYTTRVFCTGHPSAAEAERLLLLGGATDVAPFSIFFLPGSC